MKHTNLNPLVDADFLVYRVGFAVKDEEPLEYALATVRSSLHNIYDRFPDRKEAVRIFLSGEGNFREEIATQQVYKGNRDPAAKPKYYDDIRQYMIDHHGAETVDGMEAEDAASIAHYARKKRDTVLVGQDKDLLCIPGWHYNPVKDELFYVTKPEADYWFWGQVLSGDRTDNIPGLPGLGEAKGGMISSRIRKILDPCNHDWMAMYEAVQDRYVREYGPVLGPQHMHETARLIWILRKKGETYDGSSV
jgi:hypothetical protein